MSNKEPREALGARDGETLLDAAKRVVRERDDARAAVRALLDEMKADARRCALAGIDHRTVRDILRDYANEEISVSRLMILIRTAALALAKEVQP
jgi:hypothetical protein